MHRILVGIAIILSIGTPGASKSFSLRKPPPITAAPSSSFTKTSSENTQTTSPSQQTDDKIQLKARLVSMTVTVSDRLGRFVTGLEKRNFQVFDDGVQQEIAHFSDEDAPLTLGIVYDVSGSMSDLTSRSFQALKRFFDTSHEDDEYFIIASTTGRN